LRNLSPAAKLILILVTHRALQFLKRTDRS
jgi:hypothetical protein